MFKKLLPVSAMALWVVVLVSSNGNAAQTMKQTDAKVRALFDKSTVPILEGLKLYKEDPSCYNASGVGVTGIIDANMDAYESNVQGLSGERGIKLRGDEWFVRMQTPYAAEWVNYLAVLGDEAAHKGCTAIARQAYMHVINVYLGSLFGAARQHAQIGLEALMKK